MAAKQLKLGLCGWGTVAQAFYRLWRERRGQIEARCGVRIDIVALGCRRPAKDCPLPQRRNLLEVAAMRELDAVVELIGGTGAALEIAQAALSGGRHLITANKALLAEHGPQLAQWALAGGARIGAEAAVAGAIPVLHTLRTAFAADRVEAVTGILNGTCNYIISAMEDGQSFDAALAEAQARGFAEADPALDLNGSDARQKLAILAHVALGTPLSAEPVEAGGMYQLEQFDIQAVARLGFRCRHLAMARRNADTVGARAALALVPEQSPLARIRTETNAVMLHCAAAGVQMLQGAGAGGLPTASAVMADVVDIATRPQARPLIDSQSAAVQFSRQDTAARRHYLRLNLSDEPGSLSSLTASFADSGINIETVEQYPDAAENQRRVVFVLSPATDAAMAELMQRLQGMEAVLSPFLLRIEQMLTDSASGSGTDAPA